jgi:DNA-directed RNA polymerase II subunit RPB1
MVYTTLEGILLSTNLVFEPDVHTCAFDHEVDSFLVAAQRFIMPHVPDGLSSYVIRFEFDRPHLERLQLHIDDLRHILMDYMQAGSHCLVQSSVRNMKTWIVRLRMGDMQREHRRFKSEHERQEFDKNMAFALTQHLAELHISGIPNITAASVEDVIITDPITFKQTTESVIWLNGANLLAIWSQPMVDWSRTYSNDLFETMDVLGVEATTILLFHEIKSVLSFDGTYTDDRHIMMVANIMMRHGFVMPLNRHGLNNLSTVTPLTRCSFEKTADVLFDAGAFREPNPLRCVSDNIAMGQRIPGGTGKFHVFTDPAYLKKPKLSRPVLFVRTTFNKSLVGPPKAPHVPKPVYIPQSPEYNPQSPEYNPQSPEYNPQSPEYNPSQFDWEPDTFNPLDVKKVAKITTAATEDSVQASRSLRFEVSNGIGKPVKYRPSTPNIRFKCSSPAFNPTPDLPNFSNVMKLFDLHQ